MTLRRIIWILLILFALFFIVKAPSEAAHVVRVTGETLGDWLGALANSLRKFISQLI